MVVYCVFIKSVEQGSVVDGQQRDVAAEAGTICNTTCHGKLMWMTDDGYYCHHLQIQTTCELYSTQLIIVVDGPTWIGGTSLDE